MAVFSPYEDLSAVHPDSVPIHIPSGIPGEPDTAGTATLGNRTMPFPIQQDTASEQQGWVQRMNDYDRVKRETEKAEQDAAYLKNLMLNQRTAASARQVEAAMTFQAIRNYDRDLSTAKAAGLSEEQAALQALVRNPRVLSGAGFGAGVRALQPPPKPTVHNLPGVKTPFVQMGNTGRFAPASEQASNFEPTEKTLPSGTGVTQLGPRRWQITPDKEMKGSQRGSFLIGNYNVLKDNLGRKGINDKETLKEMQAIQEELRSMRNAVKGGSDGPVKVSTKAERDALPKGTKYIGPDGKPYIKQ